MSEWYYTSGADRKGPVALELLLQEIAAGNVQARDLVWRTGMAQWQAAGTIPELGLNVPVPVAQAVIPETSDAPIPTLGTVGYAQPHHDAVMCTPRAIELFRQTRGWVRLIGILFLIGGILILGLGIIIVLAGAAMSNTVAGGVALGLMCTAASAFYLVPGFFLNRYASRITELIETRREDTLERAVEAQKSFWKFTGILILIFVGLYALMTILAGIGGAFF